MPLSTPFFSFRPLLTGLGLALTVASAQAQAPADAPTPPPVAPASRYPHAALGLSLGYGAPYGWGVDFSLLVLPRLDINVGLGASITGGKVGVGTRYYFAPERKVSPFVGGNLVYSGGINHLTISTSTQNGFGGYSSSSADDIVVNFKSTGLLHLRGGARWQPTQRFGLLGAVGYGIVLGGDPVEYVAGTQGRRALVNLFSPGGVELSVGVAFALGQRQ
ncbi:MAG: hypothetical protein ACRYFZ_20190 [Janthinobacterium lividum]